MTRDRQAKAGKKPVVEGMRDRRTLTDGARTVEIYYIAGSTHCDGLLMVYLPTERCLVEADVYTPGPLNTPAPTAVNPLTVNLAEDIDRLGLGVDQFLPLHGRIVPMAEMNKAIGRARASALTACAGYWYSSNSARVYTICLPAPSMSTRRSPCTA